MADRKTILVRKPVQAALACMLVVGMMPPFAFADVEADMQSEETSQKTEANAEDLRHSNGDPADPIERDGEQPVTGEREIETGEDKASPAPEQSESYEQSESAPYASEITDEEIAAVLAESNAVAEPDAIAPLSVDAREVAAQGAVRPFSGADRHETAALQAT